MVGLDGTKVCYTKGKLTKEQFVKFFEDYYKNKPSPSKYNGTPMTIPVGLETYTIINMECEWEFYKVSTICNKRWFYFPSRIRYLIEISLWKKHGLCKVRIDCNGGEYKYYSYYGTKLISKSNKIIHAVKELVKYK